MTHNEQIKAVRQAWHALYDLNLYDGFQNIADRLLYMNEDAERRHRKGAPAGIRHGLGVRDAARLFTVQHLLDGFNDPKWTIDDILHIRTECLYAQAYATKHHAELAAFAAKWTEVFEHVDYAELQRVAA